MKNIRATPYSHKRSEPVLLDDTRSATFLKSPLTASSSGGMWGDISSKSSLPFMFDMSDFVFPALPSPRRGREGVGGGTGGGRLGGAEKGSPTFKIAASLAARVAEVFAEEETDFLFHL